VEVKTAAVDKAEAEAEAEASESKVKSWSQEGEDYEERGDRWASEDTCCSVMDYCDIRITPNIFS